MRHQAFRMVENRVGRALQAIYGKASASCGPAPSYSAMMHPLLEVRITKDGIERICHFPLASATNYAADRIIGIMQESSGVAVREVERIRRQYRPAMRTGEDTASIVTYMQTVDMHHVYVPVTFLDILGEGRDMVVRHVAGTKSGDAFNETQRRLDRSRRHKDGSPRPFTVGGGLAALLRVHPRGAEITADLVPTLRRTFAGLDIPYDMTPITVEEIKVGIGDVRCRLKGAKISLVDWEFSGGVLAGDVVRINGSLPRQVMVAAAGRSLGDVVSGVPLPHELPLREVRARRGRTPGLSLVLDAPPITIDELLKEFGRR